jgi:hypothetical protein
VWTNRTSSFGAGAFVGVGGAQKTESDDIVTNPTTLIVPAGITLAYQRPIGTKRGISIYASPMYQWWRFDDGDESSTTQTFRASVGVDFGVTQSLGVTAGGEFGGTDSTRDMGGGAVFGVAVTFVPRRRR